MTDIKYIISIQTYNSLQNTHKILSEINGLNKNIFEIIIIDNCSLNFTLEQKREIFEELRKLSNFKISLILNKQNYGIGGSFKILFNYLKSKDFSYWINLQSSGRYDASQVLSNLFETQSNKTDIDYYLHSRFLKPEDSKKYNFIRKIANHFFIRLTKICTNCNFSDPGMSVFMISKKLSTVLLNKEFTQLTNDSHFPHFMNVVLYKYLKEYKEININWKEGNVKSHLNSLSYPVLLLINLINFKFKGSFIKYNKKNEFDYEKLDFDKIA